jgi:hypothetical protein
LGIEAFGHLPTRRSTPNGFTTIIAVAELGTVPTARCSFAKANVGMKINAIRTFAFGHSTDFQSVLQRAGCPFYIAASENPGYVYQARKYDSGPNLRVATLCGMGISRIRPPAPTKKPPRFAKAVCCLESGFQVAFKV